MPIETISVGILLFFLFFGTFKFWRSNVEAVHSDTFYTHHKWSALTWIIIGAYYSIPIFFFQRRYGLDTLYSEGAPTHVVVQAFVLAFGAAWAFFLILNGWIKISYVISRGAFWIFVLCALFGLTSLWSEWAILTIYRFSELTTFAILSVHLFGGHRWYRNLNLFLVLSILVTLVLATTTAEVSVFEVDFFIGRIRSNSGGALSGCYLILLFHRYLIIKKMPKIWEIAYGVTAFFLFGSLGSAVALIGGLTVLGMSGYQIYLRASAYILAISGILFIAYILLTGNLINATELIMVFFGKSIDTTYTLSGRLPLWSALWEIYSSYPWGKGFAAAERSALFLGDIQDIVGWGAATAHNGYISAWLSAGWLGIFSVFFLLGGILCIAYKTPRPLRLLIICTLVFLGINNLSIPAIGGQFSLIWMVITALTVVPLTQNSESRATGLKPSKQVLQRNQVFQ